MSKPLPQSASLLARPLLKIFGFGPDDFEQSFEKVLPKYMWLTPPLTLVVRVLWQLDESSHVFADLAYVERMLKSDPHSDFAPVLLEWIHQIFKRFVERNVGNAMIHLNGIWYMDTAEDWSAQAWFNELALIVPTVVNRKK